MSTDRNGPSQQSNLRRMGWDDSREEEYRSRRSSALWPARVASQHRDLYTLWSASGEGAGQVAGRFRQSSPNDAFPAVGDWILAEGPPKMGRMVEVLPRRSQFVRQSAGEKTGRQVVAANIDVVFVAMAAKHDYNLRRLERYLVAVWESGARPVVLLTKADLVQDAPGRLAEVEAVALGTPVHTVSSVRGVGVDAVRRHLSPAQTAAFLGSSGVGKSTLINVLAGEGIMATREVRSSDGRGRHATTHRQLILLPCGALVLDTPGMRELQLWEGQESLESVFEEVEGLARRCRFGNCRHESEPGCAVRRALRQGALSADRYDSYLKLKRELAYQERRKDVSAALAEKRRWKKIHQEYRRRTKGRK